MAKFVVVVSYDTGDTFHPNMPAADKEFEFDTVEQAREAARIIRKHYDLYCEIHGCTTSHKEINRLRKENPNFNDYNVDIPGKGTVYTPWTGHFETLRGIEVIERGIKESY